MDTIKSFRENPTTPSAKPRRGLLRDTKTLAVAVGLAAGFVMAGSGAETSYRYVATKAWAEANNYTPAEGASYDSPDAPALDIQAAIDVAGPGETIRIRPGVYALTQPIVVSNKSQRVTSWDPETGGTAVETTILDGQGKTRCIAVNTNKTADCDIEICGLTITNGNNTAGGGGGIYLYGLASKAANRSLRGRVVNCRITDCSAKTYGGGLYLQFGFVSNCVFTANSATRGGGACLASPNQRGGSLSDDFKISMAMDCDFIGNTATTSGGAICDSTDFLGYTYHVLDCRFKDNKAGSASSGKGGHLALPYSGIAQGCSFSGSGTAQYGAFVTAGYQATLESCVFADCTASAQYGVIYAGSGKTNVRLTNCIVTNNSFSIDFCFFDSVRGGRLRQCLFADNGNMASVARLHLAASVSCESSTFADANSTLVVSKDGSNTPIGTNTLVNCILAGTIMESTDSVAAVLTNCYVRTPATAMSAENVNVLTGGSPRFADAAHGNYALRPGSRLREQGVRLDWMTEGSTDLAGNPRLVNAQGVADAADALPDLGCFEVQTSVPGAFLLIR